MASRGKLCYADAASCSPRRGGERRARRGHQPHASSQAAKGTPRLDEAQARRRSAPGAEASGETRLRRPRAGLTRRAPENERVRRFGGRLGPGVEPLRCRALARRPARLELARGRVRGERSRARRARDRRRRAGRGGDGARGGGRHRTRARRSTMLRVAAARVAQEDPARGAREPLEHAVLKPGKQPFGGDRARSRGIDGGRDRSFRSRRARRVSARDAASRRGTRFRSGATRRRRRPSRGAERSPASPSRTGARRGALGTGAPRPSRSRRPRSRWRRAPCRWATTPGPDQRRGGGGG